MTPLQSKLARTALSWGIRDMPDVAGVASSTVTRFEKGQNINLDSYKALKKAYNSSGVMFLEEGDEAHADGISFDPESRVAQGRAQINLTDLTPE